MKPLEEAYELSLSDVTLPVVATGSLIVRRCARCKPETLQVTDETRYFVRPGTAPVSLADTRKAAAKAAGRRQASVFVYYEPKTRHVRRLVLDPAR